MREDFPISIIILFFVHTFETMATPSNRLSLQKTGEAARYKFHKRQQTESVDPDIESEILQQGSPNMYSRCIRPDKLISCNNRVEEGKLIFNRYLGCLPQNCNGEGFVSKLRKINVSASKPSYDSK